MKSNEYDISYIRKYLNGELDARSMYQLERQAQDDPLLMDLILGMEKGDQNEHEGAIRDIDQMIQQRTRPKKQRIVPLFRWSIAASFLILCCITGWFILNRQQSASITAVNRKATPAQRGQLPQVRPADTIKASGQPAMSSEQPTLLAESRKKRQIKTVQIADKWPVLVEEESKRALVSDGRKSDSAKLDDAQTTGYQALAKNAPVLSAAPLPIPDNNIQQSLQGRLAGVSVMRSLSKSRGQQTVAGVVVDQKDNSALPGVLVSIKGSSQQTVTDKDGRFKLAMRGKSDSLELSYIGFLKKSVKVTDRDSVTIAMAPSDQSLNEVVVTGYGTQNREDNEAMEVEDAEVRPLNGWRSFNEYLKGHAVTEKGTKGVVTVSFNVSASGELSGFKITKSTNDSLNYKAINLIKEGPQWQGPKNGTRKIKLRIRFIDRRD